MLALYDPTAQDMSPEANKAKAMKLMAQTATIVTSFDRLRNGNPVVLGDPKLGFAANFLYTLTGKRPDNILERAFDVALVLHAEHELNASTFAARVTAATLSDIYSAVTSAIGALKGPLHGGANEDVIRLLLTLTTPEEGIERVKNMLANKEKIPGLGHRVYKTLDPRATFLKDMAKELGERTGHIKLYEISNAIQAYAKQAKNLNANVDFFSASTYYSLGIPVDRPHSGAVSQQPPDPSPRRLHRRASGKSLDQDRGSLIRNASQKTPVSGANQRRQLETPPGGAHSVRSFFLSQQSRRNRQASCRSRLHP
jgi:citrate synthase